MKVAQVIGDLRIGGAERLFVDLVNALECEKKSVILVNSADIRPNLMGSLNRDVDVHTIRVRKRSMPADLIRLSRYLHLLECDVLHGHMFWANLYCALAGTMARTPVIITSEHGRNEWKQRRHRWLESQLISRVVAKRLCVSQDILERRRDIDGIPEEKLLLVPNGTRVPVTMHQHRSSQFIIGSVGRLVEAKDFVTLVQAMGRLRERGYDAVLRIVGDGPERPAIQQEIQRLNLTATVQLLGFKKDIGGFLDSCTIFASSSIREGQPIALLEAMAHGLPCVATRVGGVPDTMTNNIEGIIVPPRNPGVMADVIGNLLDSPDLRVRLGRLARERVIRNYSIDTLAKTCLEIYQKELQARKRMASS